MTILHGVSTNVVFTKWNLEESYSSCLPGLVKSLLFEDPQIRLLSPEACFAVSVVLGVSPHHPSA